MKNIERAGRIKAARQQRKITLSMMAQQLCISPGALCNIESGRRSVSPQLAARIEAVMGIDRISLIDWE